MRWCTFLLAVACGSGDDPRDRDPGDSTGSGTGQGTGTGTGTGTGGGGPPVPDLAYISDNADLWQVRLATEEAVALGAAGSVEDLALSPGGAWLAAKHNTGGGIVDVVATDGSGVRVAAVPATELLGFANDDEALVVQDGAAVVRVGLDGSVTPIWEATGLSVVYGGSYRAVFAGRVVFAVHVGGPSVRLVTARAESGDDMVQLDTDMWCIHPFFDIAGRVICQDDERVMVLGARLGNPERFETTLPLTALVAGGPGKLIATVDAGFSNDQACPTDSYAACVVTVDLAKGVLRRLEDWTAIVPAAAERMDEYTAITDDGLLMVQADGDRLALGGTDDSDLRRAFKNDRAIDAVVW